MKRQTHGHSLPHKRTKMKAYPDKKTNNICQHIADIVDAYIETLGEHPNNLIVIWRNNLIGEVVNYICAREAFSEKIREYKES